ncbi:ABC-2 type transport system permease protein [Clostridium saccharoperbutylacetonicum]|uniref:ABC-type multidrug transport system, permease component n=1 Tax=Clostridium saccharoperbutylacetonicum N1-4(HMT) TaxID=931276 RepID=M1MKK2_9CLOT|nr:ABC transporter permease [Clostridium saccharoperbutylacetonicum]AGF58469.1 ABC-type multidrug transport system, permease component [Clostridium saccharoperbutylacetonicum N1-4(HMT)]NRT60753.1 ABC-2 type transport system permease protein [Clostridium saccharoperbutylacetonicum]NSB24067.1 ABC-2 type transport system permease protein [Clostridium saccharoperbutylacetonicum]NSB43445.1 ABC-2 type transport system permease protein [Clostridium saccharoperbutylacetonicum]
MINVIKGILYRMINSKTYLIMPIIITPIVIVAAIYFSSSFVERANIGVVRNDNINFNSTQANITQLKNKVPLSDLVKNKYDAVIYYEDGKVQVDTVKGNDFKSKLLKIANGENVEIKDGEKRGVAANIVGYITMFIILLGVMLYRFYFNEKKGISKRVISADISYEQYILSHFVSVFIMIFVPTVIVVTIAKEVLKLDTNVTVFELDFIVLVLALLASAFGLLISSIVKEEESASMLGVMINIITTLLAGSFFTISNNTLINIISDIMPQKHILNFTIALENGKTNYIDIINVIFLCIIMIILSYLINKIKLRKANIC